MKRVTGFTWTVRDTPLVTRRERWGEVLLEEARRDPRVVAVSADLSTTTKLAAMRAEMPDRVLNVGVAEQNMIAVSAGLAAAGMRVVCCTYAVFGALRAAEFVRTDLAYNARDVVLVGALGGVAFGAGGPTHHALEDVALLRAIPGLRVLVAADGHASGSLLAAALAAGGPTYLRVGRGSDRLVYEEPSPRLTLGRAHELRAGGDVVVLASGPCVAEALEAARRAERAGVAVGVLDVHTIKPLDRDAICAAAARAGRVVTVEDHARAGGLGGAVAELLFENDVSCKFRILGHPDAFAPAGLAEDLMHASGIDADGVLGAILGITGAEAPPDDAWGDEGDDA